MINILLNFPIRLWENWQIYLKHYKFIIEFSFLYNKNLLEIIKFISFNLNFELKKLKRFTISNTKIKSFSNYSNRKLYQQKGLGKARVGSLKSPIQRKGAVSFGLKFKSIPNCIKKNNFMLILKYLILNKRSNIYIINIFNIIKYLDKFKNYLQLQLQLNGILSNKILFVSLDKHNLLYFKFKKQFQQFNFLKINKLNCYKLLLYKYIFIFI